MKYAWIEAHRDQFSVVRLCCLLGVSRSGYSQWRVRPPSDRARENSALDAQVAAIHQAHRRRYGRPRIVQTLRQEGQRVSHERVRRSLQRQGLRPLYRRAYRVTTDSRHHQPLAPNVLARRFDFWRVNRAWVSDITYIATDEGWLYLACIMDLASRSIVGWSLSARLHSDLVCAALTMAYWHCKPRAGLILHSDRGSQYASAAYRKLIKDYRMIQSMSGKANCWDTQSTMSTNARPNLTRAGIGEGCLGVDPSIRSGRSPSIIGPSACDLIGALYCTMSVLSGDGVGDAPAILGAAHGRSVNSKRSNPWR